MARKDSLSNTIQKTLRRVRLTFARDRRKFSDLLFTYNVFQFELQVLAEQINVFNKKDLILFRFFRFFRLAQWGAERTNITIRIAEPTESANSITGLELGLQKFISFHFRDNMRRCCQEK